MKLFVLLVSIALASAATTIVKNNDIEKSITIHRNTPEKYPIKFELGQTHRFNYTGDVTTSFPQTGNETVGQRIQCIVEIVPLTTTTWNMKLVNPTVFEINGTHNNATTIRNATTVTEEIRALLGCNITFKVDNGKIVLIYANATEPEWVVNMKKGILNMIQLNLQKDDVYEVDEEGVTGTCKTLYTIKETVNEDLVTILNLTKVTDLTNCTTTTLRKVNSIKTTECTDCTTDKNSMDAIATFKYNITGTKQRYIINGVQSDVRYVLFPMGVKGGSVLVHINQSLHLINVTSDPTFTWVQEKPRGSLLYNYPEIVKVQEEMLTTIHKVNFFLELLENHTTTPFTIDAPSHFILLVKSLAEADHTTLEEIWKLVSTKPIQRKWLIEALPFVNEEEMSMLVKDLMTTEETLLTTDEKVTILMRMGTIRQPTEKTVEYLKDICEHKFLQWPHNTKVNTTYINTIVTIRHTCFRSLGIQIHALKYVSPTLVQTLSNCEKTFEKEVTKSEWDKTIYKKQINLSIKDDYLDETDSKALLNTTIVTKVREMCLIAIGQAGLPDHIDMIKKTLEQSTSNQTLDVRIIAATALRRMKTSPHKILSILLPILRNPYEDSELRITCYVNIIRTNKSPSIMTLIAQELNTEKSKQVHSFIYTHMKMLAEDVEPCNKALSIAARYALVYTTPCDMGPTYSKVRSVRTFDPTTKMAAEMYTSTIFSEGEVTPSRTVLNLKAEILGKKTTVIGVELRTSGMTDLLDKLVGYNGHFYQRKSVFDLLKQSSRKRRSLDTNEVELAKINKKVKSYEVTPEEPKTHLAIALFGNRILDLHVTKDYMYTLMKEGKFTTDFNNLDVELAKKQTFNITKGMVLMDNKVEYPTIIGLPLTFNTTVGSIVRVGINTTFKAYPSLVLSQENLTASVNVTPEVIINAVFKMGIHTPLVKFGTAMNTTFNFTLPIQTNLTVDFNKKKYELLFPQIERNLTFLNFTHKMYTFYQTKEETENQTVVNTTLTYRKPVTTNTCMEPINGTKLCMNATYVPRLGNPTSPFQPLTGCSDFSIYNLKTPQAPETIKLMYHIKNPETWTTEKNVDIVMTLTGNTTTPDVKYTNTTTLNVVLSNPIKTLTATITKSNDPEWKTEIDGRIVEGEVDLKCTWGKRTYYPHNVQYINNTRTIVEREYYTRINMPNYTWNDTRNITILWGNVPQWLHNVTYLTKTYVLPVVLDAIKMTHEIDTVTEPFLNHIVNTTTIGMRVKTNSTMDIEILLPLQKITIINVTTPVNTSVLNNSMPITVDLVQRHLTENYWSGNCTYNTTGKFLTYDRHSYKYNLTGSCPHVLTKDCSPNNRFTVLVQNTIAVSNLVRPVPTVTIYIDNHKIELTTSIEDTVHAKFNSEPIMTWTDSFPLETAIGMIERNLTHFTVKATIGLTVVYSKDNVTTYISPWYVNKTCGLCGDFNGETFRDMKTTTGIEVTNSTKFGASWLVQGDDCKDTTCKLAKEDLYPLPETVYLANKPAICLSKEPVTVCPERCNNETPENIFTGDFIPTKHFVKVPFFCMASDNTKATKKAMEAHPDLIKTQPTDIYRDMEVPHGCICVDSCDL